MSPTKAELQAENKQLKQELEKLKEQLQSDPPAGAILPDNGHKRGRKREIPPEKRALCHAYRGVTNDKGRPVNSLAQIAEKLQVSKTQVYRILAEPKPAGLWRVQTGADSWQTTGQFLQAVKLAERYESDVHFLPLKN